MGGAVTVRADIWALFFCAVLGATPAVVLAQTPPEGAAQAPVDPAAAAAQKAAEEAAVKAAEEARLAALNKPFRDTLLFAPAEVTALREAAAGRRTNEKFLEADKVELIPIDRKIKLSGIYYKDDNNWIVWMNGYKLHPRYLMPEIHKIQVKQDEVYLEWYDIGLNDVIKIKLRPHQIYDIVTGILYNDTAGGMSPDTGANR
mgnify:CR=1 FL=1